MNVFEIQYRLVDDYKSYVESFISIRDSRIQEFVASECPGNKYWSEAHVQLNPAFQAGQSVEELVQDRILHGQCENILRVGDEHQSMRLHRHESMRLHRHQDEAVLKAHDGRSYVLTTGTGSGKSLAYFIPIIDRILHRGSGKGLKPIAVYPMNALCNSRLEELGKFLGLLEASPVTSCRFTGQENDEERQDIRANSPDILLTNHGIRELILTRTEDKPLLDEAPGLEFLVLDELHTYGGRQGADVAMLTRRVRERTGATSLQCVGTAAETDLGASIAAGAIKAMHMRGYKLIHPETRRPLFAFRLHQFISRGDPVFSTLALGRARERTLNGQTVLPPDIHRRLYPLAFCRLW